MSEFVRKQYPLNRTKHPIYSFVALGYLEKEFINLKNMDSFSSDSPFNLIHNLNIKICNIDIADEKCMTFFHYIEQHLAVDYRYIKDFKGSYVDSNGIISQRTYSMNVRDVQKNVTTDVLGMSNLLWKFKINKGHKPGIGSGIKIAMAKEIFEATKEIIESNKAYGNLYTIERNI
jgi:aminoglycoside 3-N-acetyltransferase